MRILIGTKYFVNAIYTVQRYVQRLINEISQKTVRAAPNFIVRPYSRPLDPTGSQTAWNSLHSVQLCDYQSTNVHSPSVSDAMNSYGRKNKKYPKCL